MQPKEADNAERQSEGVDVVVHLTKGLASWMEDVASRVQPARTLNEFTTDIVKTQMFQELDDLPGIDLVGGMFPGLRNEFDGWQEREDPKEDPKPEAISEELVMKGKCVVEGCSLEAASTIQIKFPGDAGQAKLVGRQFVADVPLCEMHCAIFQATGTFDHTVVRTESD
jgi:hypothetical protein